VKHRLSGKTGITPAGFLQGGEGGVAQDMRKFNFQIGTVLEYCLSSDKVADFFKFRKK
jgi:hypothetical protein